MAFSMTFVLTMILAIVPFFSPLVLNSFQSSFSPPPKDKDVAFRARLIHRSSSESPFYESNATPLSLMKESLHMSLARAAYFSRVRSKNFSSSMKYPVTPVDLINIDYVMKYSIGTPPVETFAIPDPGSNLIWLQCLDCVDCYNQSLPIFDPAKSSSYVPVQCGSEECNNMIYTNCDASGPLYSYNITYRDDSHSMGNIAKETLIFNDTMRGLVGPFPLRDMLFGCGHNNKYLRGDIPGVVGLSNHSSSLIGQQGFIEFSYCISANVSSGHSQIRFGSAVILPGRLATALSPNKEGLYVFKSVDGIFVEGEQVDIPEWAFQYQEGPGGIGGLIIDTGTTYTVLYTDVLDMLILKIRENIPSDIAEEIDLSDEKWDLCYNSAYRFVRLLPEIEFRFNGNGKPFPLSNQNAWLDNSHGQFCLAMRRSDDVSILGMYQQRDVNVDSP